MPSGGRKRWDFELRGGRRSVAPWGASAEGAKARERRPIHDPGRAEAVMHLEPLDGGLASRPEPPVERAEFVPEAAEHPLYLEDTRRAARGAVAGAWANRWGSTPPERRHAQRRCGLRTDDAVDRQAMRLLEAPNGPFGQRTVDAIHRAGRISPIAQSTLELQYLR
jgi:hypothetical protein